MVLFINWQIGLAGIIFSMGGFWLADRISIKLNLKTVGQVAEKMTRENYLQSRRKPETFNKAEIAKVLTAMFSSELNLNKNKLTRKAKLIKIT
jgi:uncharacterized protein YneF (UPF0154 family)